MNEEVQLIIFTLENNGVSCEYGVPIDQVQEIIKVKDNTKLPQTPSFVEGIINLRGQVVPIIDLKKRFGITGAVRTENSRIVVTDLQDMKTGMIVDDVNEVIKVAKKDITNAPGITKGANSRYLSGVANLDGRLIIIIDLHKILCEEEQEQILEKRA